MKKLINIVCSYADFKAALNGPRIMQGVPKVSAVDTEMVESVTHMPKSGSEAVPAMTFVKMESGVTHVVPGESIDIIEKLGLMPTE